MIKIDQSHLVQVAVGKALTFKNSTTIACYQTVNQKPKKKQQIENSIKKNQLDLKRCMQEAISGWE